MGGWKKELFIDNTIMKSMTNKYIDISNISNMLYPWLITYEVRSIYDNTNNNTRSNTNNENEEDENTDRSIYEIPIFPSIESLTAHIEDIIDNYNKNQKNIKTTTTTNNNINIINKYEINMNQFIYICTELENQFYDNTNAATSSYNKSSYK